MDTLRPTDEEIVAYARKVYEEQGTCEFDDLPEVSRAWDGGAYVQTWVYVDYDEMREHKACPVCGSVDSTRLQCFQCGWQRYAR